MITVKSGAEVEAMARAADVVVAALAAARELIRPGAATKAVDDAVRRTIESLGGRPAFLGYLGYPASSCVSLNEEVVHGIPSPRRAFAVGDLVSLDVGVALEGYYADAAFTVGVGEVDDLKARLLACGRRSLEAAVANCRAGKRLGDVSAAIERTAAADGFQVVREYVGHGIGTRMHEEPQVPNYGPPGRGPRLLEGMTLALEPMVVGGDWRTLVGRDGWTVTTRDLMPAVHFEHTVVVGATGARVLTRRWEEFA